jgi:hypothetical protein
MTLTQQCMDENEWSEIGSKSLIGLEKCSKMKVLRTRQNLSHCVRLVFLIPVVYLLCQTESVWRRYRIFSEKSNRQKKFVDCVVHTVRMNANVACLYADVEGPYRRHVAGPYRRHVVAPGSDTWKADLDFWAYSWANPKVTRVTIGRVTHGRDDMAVTEAYRN